MRKSSKLVLVCMVVAAALVLGGCSTHITLPDGSRRKVYMPQAGIVVHVVNNCAPRLYLEVPGHGRVYKDPILLGTAASVALIPAAFSGLSRRMQVVAMGYTESGEYLGSATRQFQTSTYEGTRGEVWEVNNLRRARGGWGCR